MKSAVSPEILLPAALTLAFALGLGWMQLRPMDGQAVAAVFPPWIGAAVAVSRLAAPSGWRLLQDAGRWPFAVVVVRPAAGVPASLDALRRMPGLLLLIGMTGTAGCQPSKASRS